MRNWHSVCTNKHANVGPIACWREKWLRMRCIPRRDRRSARGLPYVCLRFRHSLDKQALTLHFGGKLQQRNLLKNSS